MTIPLDKPEVLAREFLDVRARLLQIAASLDRLDRAEGSLAGDPRLRGIRRALEILAGDEPGRAEAIQLVFSRTYDPDWKQAFGHAGSNGRAALGAADRRRFQQSLRRAPPRNMYYFDPHIHMVSRVTDDYETLAKMGCVGMSEPAFWAGFDRGSVDGFRDYFRQLTEFEPKRAGWYRMQHYSWLCINAKEAENVSLAREVIAMIPEFLDRPGVLGIGEIGLNKNTPNEADSLLRAPRPGDEDQRADPDPHAAPGGQVPGHADDPRHAVRRQPHRPRPRAGRPRRGAHDPRRARRGLLGRHDALPGEQVYARAGRRHGRDVRPRAAAGQFGRRLGAVEARRPCPTSSWPCGCAGTRRA